MELYDILLCVEPIKYPHTGDHIRNTIVDKLKSLGLDNKVKFAITDNGSNMVKAIREWNGIPCSAHTLQLCVIRGLKKINLYLKRYKKLNEFFSSPKQNERLEVTQRELAARQEQQVNDQRNTNSNDFTLNQQVSDQQYINSNDLTLNQEVEKAVYTPLQILRTINDCKTY
jgi:hypothetical protein